MNKQLYGNLELNASRGATLGELATEIDNRGQQLSDVEREAAWLYAWALVRRQEAQAMPTARRGQRHDNR